MLPPAVKKRPGLDFNQFTELPNQISSPAHKVTFVSSDKSKRRKRYFTRECELPLRVPPGHLGASHA